MLAVLIKRVLASEMESTYEEFSRKIIQAAVPAKGFISSKSFKDLNDSKIRYTLIQMDNLADWKVWYQSDERQKAQAARVYFCPCSGFDDPPAYSR